MPEKCTVRDIAKLANVSPATVSRVFSGSAQVTEELSARVMQAAAQLGYTPPTRTEKTGRFIAVLVPRLSNPFYTEILQGILDTASASGYDVIIRATNTVVLEGNSDTPGLFQKGLQLSGLISLARLQPNSWLLRSLPARLPIVQCCEYNEALPYPIVSIDHYKAAFEAVSHLITTGHKKLAIYNSGLSMIYGARREQGFRDAMQAHHIPVHEEWIIHLQEIDFHLALAATGDLFAGPEQPDGIFCVSDIYAAGAIKGLAKAGLRVPDDVSVIGFDDTEIALINEPPLTTVHQPRYQLGSTACNVLLRCIQSGVPTAQFFGVDSDLIIRGTTKSKLQSRLPHIGSPL